MSSNRTTTEVRTRPLERMASAIRNSNIAARNISRALLEWTKEGPMCCITQWPIGCKDRSPPAFSHCCPPQATCCIQDHVEAILHDIAPWVHLVQHSLTGSFLRSFPAARVNLIETLYVWSICYPFTRLWSLCYSFLWNRHGAVNVVPVVLWNFQ